MHQNIMHRSPARIPTQVKCCTTQCMLDPPYTLGNHHAPQPTTRLAPRMLLGGRGASAPHASHVKYEMFTCRNFYTQVIQNMKVSPVETFNFSNFSNFSNFQTFKLSNFQPFKIPTFQAFKLPIFQTFKPLNCSNC